MEQNFTIVDLETTGLNPSTDRVIEIGAMLVEGGRVVKSFATFVNPERTIPPFIERLTGIGVKDIQNAPTFGQIARRLERLFPEKILVAHNARFDHGFLKNEFKRLGRNFQVRCLCTARLSRHLFPMAKGHSLDKIIQRLKLPCANRHRALGDAKVLWAFLKRIYKDFPKEKVDIAIRNLMRSPTHPPGISIPTIDRLPKGPGVYIFYHENGSPLYVGKSIHIKERVLSHFSSDHLFGKEMSLCRQTVNIQSISTAGELSALLLESHLIKKLKPWYNRRNRESRRLILLRRRLDPSGYFRIAMERMSTIEAWDLVGIEGVFQSVKQAKEFLVDQAREYRLCPKLLGIEKAKGKCFSTQLRKCMGACGGEETTISYNRRFEEAFRISRIPEWPFQGAVCIREYQKGGPQENFVVDKWCLVGNLDRKGGYVFDYDAFKILKNFISDPKHRKKIRPAKIPKGVLSSGPPLPGILGELYPGKPREGQRQLSLKISDS